jgi:mannose-1-phosphate guanylyltransferase/phosphomannomutase
MIKQAVILCGGKGTRLGEQFSHIPKPLVPVDGVPLLNRILENVARAGVTEVILAAGHLGHLIRGRYETANAWGLEIHTHIESTPLGTAGCLHEIADRLDEDFALLYGDVFLDFDLKSLIARHESERPVATVLVRQSDHPKDSDLLAVTPGTDRVEQVLPKATRDPEGIYQNCANAAVYACSRKMLDFISKDISSDIATHVFPAVIAGGGEIRAHELEPTGYVKDMGTPARLVEVERYWRRKLTALAAKRAPAAIRAVILDRDGVILKDHGPSVDAAALEFMPGALEGLAAMAGKGLVCMVATNQPWIARGLLTLDQLEAAHQQMTGRIESSGGRLREIVHSPYHPETHHGEGISNLRRSSECRKPRPGMLFELMERHGFSPAETVMIGDSAADILAAGNAGMRSILIGGNPAALAARPDFVCKDLIEAAGLIEQWNPN